MVKKSVLSTWLLTFPLFLCLAFENSSRVCGLGKSSSVQLKLSHIFPLVHRHKSHSQSFWTVVSIHFLNTQRTNNAIWALKNKCLLVVFFSRHMCPPPTIRWLPQAPTITTISTAPPLVMAAPTMGESSSAKPTSTSAASTQELQTKIWSNSVNRKFHKKKRIASLSLFSPTKSLSSRSLVGVVERILSDCC